MHWNLTGQARAISPPWMLRHLKKVRRGVRRLHRAYVLATYRECTVTHDYGGVTLKVVLADPMGAKWYDSDCPPVPEIEALKRGALRPGARVFNIGAHQCVVAMMLAQPVGSEGTVVALEASAHDARIGRRNCELNGRRNVQVLHAAVAEASGRIAFTVGAHMSTGEDDRDGSVWVDGYSIDDLSERFGYPDVVYMDIEGYECRALRGARKTLAHHPDCFLEVHVGCGLESFGGTVEDIVGYFPKDAYDLSIRSEEDPAMLDFSSTDERLHKRFFLVARRTAARSTAARSKTE